MREEPEFQRLAARLARSLERCPHKMHGIQVEGLLIETAADSAHAQTVKSD
jgi:hypothetical protein